MHIGEILLWAAFAFGILAVILAVLRLFFLRKMDTWFLWLLTIVTFTLVALSFFLLVSSFLSSDMTIAYVHSYSATDYEWYYKLAGVWAGGEGSVLIWLFFLSLFVLLQVSFWNLRPKEKRASETYQDWLFLIESVLVVTFTFIMLKLAVFSPTSAMDLALWPQGLGLNPLLKTPLMTIHPPLEFAAYAFTAIPFAASIAFLASDDERWTFDALSFGRFSWLFMSLGIVIGALWAYTVLGWGGYWGWDPVETANLLPWISLTAFLHALNMYRKKGSYRNLAPLLGILCLALVFFATFETRSGFVDSIHAFTGGAAQIPFDPAEKLIYILERSESSAYFLSLMLIIMLLGAVFFVWRFMRTERGKKESRIIGYTYIGVFAALLIPVAANVTWFLSGFFEFSKALGMGNVLIGLAIVLLVLIGGAFIWMVMTSEAATEKAKLRKASVLNADSWMVFTILILSVWFVATFLLMMQGINGLRPESFETRLPLILVPLGALLILCLSWGHVSPGFSFYVVGLIVATTIFGFLIFSNRFFFVYIPISLGVLATAGYKMAKITARKDTRRKLTLAGLFLIFASILGMIMWGSGPSRIWFGPIVFPTNLLMIIGGFMISIFAFIAGINTMRGGSYRLSLLGGICGLLLIGYVAGLVLSGLALILIVTESSGFSQSASWKRNVRASLKTASAHLIHIGAALLIIGYATSTFLPSAYENVDLFASQPPTNLEGYRFDIVGSSGVDSNNDGFFEVLEVKIQLSDSNGIIASVPLRMVWSETGIGSIGPHYRSDVFVHSEHTVDIYLILLGFYTVSDGWISVRDDTSGMFQNPNIGAVALDIEFVPLVGLVWSGTWIMSAAIVSRAFADRWPVKRMSITEQKETAKTDLEYEAALERELRAMEDGG
ncbi:MAG: cytochrome c biogenesis protein CcsA [Thermoplasmata archaeon]